MLTFIEACGLGLAKSIFYFFAKNVGARLFFFFFFFFFSRGMSCHMFLSNVTF